MTPVPQKTLVVAHFQEDLSWLSKVGGDWRICIYSKGPNPPANSTRLPNVGRESHTYLHHILQCWDDLPEVTVFAQGNPFDHCSDFLERLVKLDPANFPGFSPWGDLEIVFDQIGFPHLEGVRQSFQGALLHLYYRAILQAECPALLRSRANGIFAVSAARIRSRDRNLYQRALATTEQESNPPEGHYLERLWETIFLGPEAARVNSIDDFPVKWGSEGDRQEGARLLALWRLTHAEKRDKEAAEILIELNRVIERQQPIN